MAVTALFKDRVKFIDAFRVHKHNMSTKMRLVCRHWQPASILRKDALSRICLLPPLTYPFVFTCGYLSKRLGVQRLTWWLVSEFVLGLGNL